MLINTIKFKTKFIPKQFIKLFNDKPVQTQSNGTNGHSYRHHLRTVGSDYDSSQQRNGLECEKCGHTFVSYGPPTTTTTKTTTQGETYNSLAAAAIVVRGFSTLQCYAHRGIWSCHKYESNFGGRHTNDILWSNVRSCTDDGCPRLLSVKLGSGPRLVYLDRHMLPGEVPNEC